MQPSYLFISYSNTDVDFAIRLATDLSSAGVQVWMDRLEIASLETWQAQLREAIAHSCAIVSILSANYIVSKYTQREFAVFKKRNRLVVPLLLDGLSHDEASTFAAQDVIDFSQWRRPKVYQNQLHLVLEVIRQQIPELVAPSRDPATVYINKFIADRENSPTFITYLQNCCLRELWRFETIRPRPIASRLHQFPGYNYANLPPSRQPVTMQPSQRIENMRTFTSQNTQLFVAAAADADISSALELLAQDAAFQFRASRGVAPLPLYVHLHSGDADLFSTIRSRWTLEGNPLEKLARGQIALFLDGIDTASDPPDRLLDLLYTWLHGDSAPQRIIVGCRNDNLEKLARFQLPVVEAAELNREDFLRISLAYLTEDEAEEFVNSLEEPIDASEQSALMVFELARYPAILHALLIYHLSSQHTLNSLADLIEWVLKSLWISLTETISVPASYGDIHTRLVSLARLMFSKNHFVSRSEALKCISDPSIFEALHTVGVLSSDDDDVRFAHDLFEQYFVMVSLQEIELERLIAEPVLNADYQRIPLKWDTVLKLLAGKMPQPDKFILDIAKLDPLLALDCSKMNTHLSEETRRAILDRLNAITDSDMLIAVALVLADQSDGRAVRFLTAAMRVGKWSARQAAAALLQSFEALPLPQFSEIEHLAGSEALLYLAHYLRHGQFRQQAAEALGKLNDRGVAPLLVSALTDPDDEVCIRAVTALGSVKDVEVVLPLIQLLDGQNRRIIRAAVQALVALQEISLDSVMQIVTAKSESTQRKTHALEVLSLTNNPKAHELVFRAARSSEVNERAAAVKVLRHIGSKEAIRRLSTSLADLQKPSSGERPISDLAMDSLVAIGSDDALDAVVQWQNTQFGGTDVTRSRRQQMASGVPALQHPDWRIRREAVIRLGVASPASAIPQLVAALHDEDNQVRLAVINELARFYEDERVVPLLLHALEDNDALVSDTAQDCLLRIARHPLPELVTTIRSANLNARAAAMRIAGTIGEEAAVADLIEGLSDLRRPWLVEQRICDIAAEALEAINNAEAQAALDHWLSLQPQVLPSPNAGGDQAAAINRLFDQICSPLWEERNEGTKQLRKLAQQGDITDENVEIVLAGLLNSEWYVRWSVTEVLGWLKIPQTVLPLTERLQDANTTVRIGAIRALVEIGNPQSAESIAETLRHDQAALVREAAAEALGRIGSSTTEDALIQAIFDPEQFVAIAALKVIGEQRCTNALSVLSPLLHKPDIMLRWYAAKALCEIAHPVSIPDLLLLLQDTEYPHWEEKRICDLAAEALQTIHTPEALQALENWKYNVLD